MAVYQIFTPHASRPWYRTVSLEYWYYYRFPTRLPYVEFFSSTVLLTCSMRVQVQRTKATVLYQFKLVLQYGVHHTLCTKSSLRTTYCTQGTWYDTSYAYIYPPRCTGVLSWSACILKGGDWSRVDRGNPKQLVAKAVGSPGLVDNVVMQTYSTF